MTAHHLLTLRCTGTDPAECPFDDDTNGPHVWHCGETWNLRTVPAGIFTIAGFEAAARADAETAGWSCCHRATPDGGTAMVDLCPRHAQAATVPQERTG